MKIQIHREAEITRTQRVEMLETMFEVPITEKLTVCLNGEADFEANPWSVGLIVGPSGSGKTLLLNDLFGEPPSLSWTSRSVIDDFDSSLTMEEISRVCQSVGFNTIPSWLRPYDVLSNGEKFRVETARRMLSNSTPIVIDEFTSVVDRQVACFASHAIQKYMRGNSKKLVVASCHYDIIDWLQPDWLLEPGRECKLTWRSLQPRPPITVTISRVQYSAWKLFREFHYMSQELNKAARCYGLYVGRRIASMCGVLYRPHPKVSDICGFTRMVTLPDFQGLGLAIVLANTVASAYKAMGKRLHSYPNHPAWIRSYQRSKHWLQVKSAGEFSPRRGTTSTVGGFGGKRCAVFMYIGPPMSRVEAERLIYLEGGSVNDD